MKAHDTAVELLEKYDILNPSILNWVREMDEVKLGALLKTAEEMKFTDAYVVKILETCYFGCFSSKSHDNDSTIILNHIKWLDRKSVV